MASKSIKSNAIVNVIRTISTLIFPLITFPYVSRILEPEGVGIVNFSQSFVGYFILLASIGIPLYGVREIARVRDDNEELSNTAQELFLMHFLISVIVTLCLVLLILGNHKLNDNKTLFFIISFSIILTSVGIDWLYQGLEEYHYITIRSIIFSLIATFSIFIFIRNKNDYIVYAAISILSSLGSSILNFFKARKIIFAKRTRCLNFKKHIKPLGVTYLMSFASSIYLQLDTVMLGFLSTPINVGYYSTATKLTKMFLSLISSIGTVLLPRLSYYIANDLRADFDRMLCKSISIILLLCIPSVASMMMLSKEIIKFIAGSQYLPAASCVVITAPIIFFIGLTNIFGLQILYPLGKERLVAISSIIGAFVSISLNILLIPHFTYVGAAVTTLITEFIIFIIQFFMVRRIYPIILPLKNFFKYIIATFLLIILLALIKLFVISSYLRLIISIPAGIVIYFGMLILMKEVFVQEIVTRIRKT